MKTTVQFILLACMLAMVLSGCYITREPLRTRDEYFLPVSVTPQRNQSVLSSTDMDQLKNQLESATRAATLFRDSLTSLHQFAGSLLASTRALVDKVSELETKEFLTTTRQKDLELMLQNFNLRINSFLSN